MTAGARSRLTLAARLGGLAVAAFLILGPLASLAVWSLAERWTYPSPWPQRWGFRYWERMLTGDFLVRAPSLDRWKSLAL
jgi:putative spermidine/putrescine transport system permease protein